MRRIFFRLLNKRGSFLVLVIWIVILLSIFCFSIGATVFQRLRVVERLETRAKLRNIAEAGVKRTINFLEAKKKKEPFFDSLKDPYFGSETAFREIKAGDGSFTVQYETGERSKSGVAAVYYGVIDEERKINLNSTFDLPTFKRLFQYAAGLDPEQSTALAASIIDWKDEDEFPTDQGAESNYYRSLSPSYSSKNKNFDSLPELLFVKEMNKEILKRILPYVTLDSDGKININTAPSVVLRAIGLSDFLVSKILTYRLGWDHIPSTGDDQVFESIPAIVEDLTQVVGLDESEKAGLLAAVDSGLLSVSSSNFSATVIGHLRYRKEKIAANVITERYKGVKQWREEFSVN